MAVLKLPYIEAKRKRYTEIEPLEDTRGFRKNPEVLKALFALKNRITNGWEIPPQFYRKSFNEFDDLMLERYGMMHLHIKPGSSELLVVVQEPDEVTVLAITDHAVFRDDRARALYQRFQPKMAKQERERERELQNRQATAKASNAAFHAQLFGRNRMNLPTKEGQFIPSWRFLIDLMRH